MTDIEPFDEHKKFLIVASKKIEVANVPTRRLQVAWEMRNKLWEKADNCLREAQKMYLERHKLKSSLPIDPHVNIALKEAKLWEKEAEFNRQAIENRARAKKLFEDAVIQVHGNIKIHWRNFDHQCILETGEEFN